MGIREFDETSGGDQYRDLFERSADAILIIQDAVFVDCNEAAVKMLRYTKKSGLLKTHPSELSPLKQSDGRKSFEKANEMMALATEHGSHRFEWEHMRADGEIFPVEVLLTALTKDGKDIFHVVWRDITDRRILEDKLRQSQKMDALGKLAGGIAHDFNNMLVVILGHTELLGMRCSRDSVALTHLAAIESAGEKAAQLVRQLLVFGRQQQLQTSAVDLNEVLESIPPLIRPLIGERIDFVVESLAEPLVVRVDPGQLEQVILNLVTNARDAIPGNGTIRLSAASIFLSDGECQAKTRLEPGPYAVISVADSGSGIDPQVVPRIFEPFFTTKEVGEGSGLGLATVYGIAVQNGGAVEVASTSKAGSEIRFYLPLADSDLKGAPSMRRAIRPSTVGETILVVEDEENVAELVGSALNSHGYNVLRASDGREAISVFRNHHQRIDLIVSDVVMPVMGGPEFVSNLQQQGFSPKVLFMSGYASGAFSDIDELGFAIPLLEKPFDIGELLDRVRLALDVDAEGR